MLYGGSAVGGAVNTLDNRIPKAPINGLTGAVEGRLVGAAPLETGNSKFALHVDAFGRKTDDLRVPEYVPIEDGVALPATSHVRNSASRTDGGAVGGSMFFDQGTSVFRPTPTTAATALSPNPT